MNILTSLSRLIRSPPDYLAYNGYQCALKLRSNMTEKYFCPSAAVTTSLDFAGFDLAVKSVHMSTLADLQLEHGL